MPLLMPKVMLHRVTDITPELLKRLGAAALLLDLDNTLTTHNNPVPDKNALAWLESMKESGIPMILVSNNRARRVEPFAKSLGLPYTSMAAKPLTAGFSRTAKRLGLPPERIAVAGDQIFTDILGGNLFGAVTILVEPMEPEGGLFFRIKRRAEKRLLARRRSMK